MPIGSNLGAVGSLFIELRADSSKFDKELQASRKKMAALGTAAVAAGAAIAGVMIKAAMDTAKLGDEMQKASIRTGMSTESLSALRFAAEQSGASFESLTKGMRTLARNASEAAQGTLTQKDAFDALGISATDASGELRPVQDILLDAAGKFAALENDTLAAALAQDIFGKSGVDLLPLLKSGTAGIEELTAEAADLGIVFSQVAADDSAALMDAQNRLGKSFEGLKTTIGVQLMPAITKLMDMFSTGIGRIQDFAAEHPRAIDAVMALAGALIGAGGLVLGLTALGAILPIISAGMAALSIAGGPVFLTVAAITAVGVAVFTFREEIAGLIKLLAGEFLSVMQSATEPLQRLASWFGFEGLAGAIEESNEKMAGWREQIRRGVEEADAQTQSVEDLEIVMADLTVTTEGAGAAIADLGLDMDETMLKFEDAQRVMGDKFEDSLHASTDAINEMTIDLSGLSRVLSENFTSAAVKSGQIWNAMIASIKAGTPEAIAIIRLNSERLRQANVKRESDRVRLNAESLAAMADARDAAQAADRASYDKTFNSIKQSFGSVFEAMIAGNKNPLANVAAYFRNLFSKMFFEDILGAWVSGFITPFVEDFKKKIAGVLGGLLGKVTTSAAGSVAGSAAGSAAGSVAGGVTAGVAGGFSLAGGLFSLAGGALGGLVSGFMSRGTRQRTEENTREVRDWLELQTRAWNPIFDRIDFRIARLVDDQVHSGILPQLSTLPTMLTFVESIEASLRGLITVFDNQQSPIVLELDGEVLASGLNRAVEGRGVRLVASGVL